MNSPFTREQQMYAHNVKRCADNMERMCDLLEQVLARLDKITASDGDVSPDA